MNSDGGECCCPHLVVARATGAAIGPPICADEFLSVMHAGQCPLLPSARCCDHERLTLPKYLGAADRRVFVVQVLYLTLIRQLISPPFEETNFFRCPRCGLSLVRYLELGSPNHLPELV
jgi:hypothetical protein